MMTDTELKVALAVLAAQTAQTSRTVEAAVLAAEPVKLLVVRHDERIKAHWWHIVALWSSVTAVAIAVAMALGARFGG